MVTTKPAMILSINVSWQQTGGVSRCLLFRMEDGAEAQHLRLKLTTNTVKLITVLGEKEDHWPMMFYWIKGESTILISVYLYWHIFYKWNSLTLQVPCEKRFYQMHVLIQRNSSKKGPTRTQHFLMILVRKYYRRIVAFWFDNLKET